ncbi:MAG: 4-alpha-glucanotransferase [Defluviicoccus sp.]|nr:4-alpha-glucanotransferase [Defluviicoccus sp.]MDG4607644.1 4-alpha-glucanotransferase [Defluviicoccus sp.]
MTASPVLDRLADLAGVEPEYWDIWGNHHAIAPENKRLLLSTLGCPAEDDAAADAGASRLVEQEWLRPLPPVRILRTNEPATAIVTLPASDDRQRIGATLLEESGTYHEFSYQPAASDVIEVRTIGGREHRRYRMPIPVELPLGYHTLRLDDKGGSQMRLIVAPAACYLPAPIAAGRKQWGLSAQLYALRSATDWGIGDFTSLKTLVEAAATLGASVIGLNPLHALFLNEAERASPYSPSSRLFLNPLYIDVMAVPELSASAPARALIERHQAELDALRAKTNIDYQAVARLKIAVLEAIFTAFSGRGGAEGARTEAFQRFCNDQGAPLARFATFEALAEQFPGVPWQEWPEPFRQPDRTEVKQFALKHRERIAFHQFLQWLADEQLAAAQAHAKARGLAIGLYRDLAVGCARDSADAWSAQDVIVQSAKIGCPPDPFNMLGQDWGVPPLHPHTLREQAYEPFVQIIRANMRHAGALRIDHVMGLFHLFWMPSALPPKDGAYIKYPFEDLLAVLALESQRERCVVIGEDLGTVPAGFRERMADANVLSYRVLYFEKDGDRFKGPSEYPHLALACATTHDLATLTGFWQEADIDLKQRLNLYPSPEALANERAARTHDRSLLLRALAHEGLLPQGLNPERAEAGPLPPALSAALHAYLARSEAALLLVQVDDLADESEQINVPGTVDERPNWRRRLRVATAELAATPVATLLKPRLADRSARAAGESVLAARWPAARNTGE